MKLENFFTKNYILLYLKEKMHINKLNFRVKLNFLLYNK